MSTEKASIIDLNESLLSEVLSYFTLIEIGKSIRIVSRTFLTACQERKEFHFKYLSRNNSEVQIIGLQSEKAKVYNTKIGVILSQKRTKKQRQISRFPVQLVNVITGEEITLSIRVTNLNICPPQKLKEEYKSQLRLVNYSNDAKARFEHAKLLDECIYLARWNCNLHHNYKFYKGDKDSFFNAPVDPSIMSQCNTTMFSSWVGGVLDMTVASLIHDKDFFKNNGLKAKWEADGKCGELTLRNYLQFMKSWANERIAGIFWMVRVYKTGTILVKTDDKYASLGNVYLVRGQVAALGEMVSGGLPKLCHATILPIYHFLVDDGVLMNIPYQPLPSAINEVFGPMLNEHVQNAIDNQSVISMGDSASRGLWDSVPPPLPSISKN